MVNVIKKKVLCLIEHVDREQQYIEILSQSLEICDIKIVSIPYFLFTPDYLSYDLIIVPFVPSCPSPFFSLVSNLLSANIAVLSLNWEQTLSKSAFSYRSKSFSLLSESKLQMCSWSDDFTKKLKKLGYDDGRIVKCKNYNSVILSRERLNYKINSRQVFLPMNYGWAFADNSFISYRVATGYSEKIAILYKNYSKKCFISFIDQLNELAEKNPEYTFILRPHPGIKIEDCEHIGKEKFKNLPKNVKIQSSGDLNKTMLESCLLISSWSTLAFDKYLIGGNALLFTPELRPEWLDVEWNNQLTNLSCLNMSVERLIEKCSKISLSSPNFYQDILNIDQLFFQDKSVKTIKSRFLSFIKITYLRFRLALYNAKNIVLLVVSKTRLSSGSGFEKDFFYPNSNFTHNKINKK
jgi:hypothetical protein